MKVILSPAKSINEEPELNGVKTSEYVFQEESEYLAKKLQKLSSRQIKKLMDVSDNIAELNYQRYQHWNDGQNEAKPAGYLFTGAAYQTLDYPSLSKEEQERGQHKLRILSGLYGLIKPHDLIKPYRLEMGTKIKLTPKKDNLYKYWGDKIREQLDNEMAEDESPILVNAASTEYFKAAKLDKLKNADVVTVVFKDKAKDGSYKVNFMYAKMARGLITRYIIQEDVRSLEELKGFDRSGYKYMDKESTDEELVFFRDKPQ